MAVRDAVDTFAGIANENEFYSRHYLAEVFKYQAAGQGVGAVGTVRV